MVENQDIIKIKILTFLADHFEHWHTANELTARGLVRAKQEYGEWYYQAVRQRAR